MALKESKRRLRQGWAKVLEHVGRNRDTGTRLRKPECPVAATLSSALPRQPDEFFPVHPSGADNCPDVTERPPGSLGHHVRIGEVDADVEQLVQEVGDQEIVVVHPDVPGAIPHGTGAESKWMSLEEEIRVQIQTGTAAARVGEGGKMLVSLVGLVGEAVRAPYPAGCLEDLPCGSSPFRPDQ